MKVTIEIGPSTEARIWRRCRITRRSFAREVLVMLNGKAIDDENTIWDPDQGGLCKFYLSDGPDDGQAPSLDRGGGGPGYGWRGAKS